MVDELVREHAGLIRAVASGVYLPGGDEDDAYQVALIGFADAVRSYDSSLGVPFKRFAAECMRRDLRDALRNSRRLKHLVLTESARVVETEEDAEPIVDLFPGADDTELTVLGREELRGLLRAVRGLPRREARAVLGLACGLSYAERGGRANDDALARARRKLKEVLL